MERREGKSGRISVFKGRETKLNYAIFHVLALKKIIRACGMNPEEILTREALTKPYRTVIDRNQIEQSQIHQLTTALKQQLLKEIRGNQSQKGTNSHLEIGSPG